VDDSIIDRHVRQQERRKFQQGKYDIDEIQDLDTVPGLGDDLIHGGAGHFRPQDVHGTVGGLGRDDGDEHQDTHAADPVGEAAPELHGVAKSLDILQQGGTGGGKATHRFEQRIDIMGNGAADGKRQRPHQGKRQPGHGHYNKAFLGEDILALRGCDPPQQEAHARGNEYGRQKGQRLLVLFEAHGNEQGNKHHGGFDIQHRSGGGKYDSVIHFPLPF